MFECPCCGKHSISIWSKLKLSPISVVECKECNAQLAAPWWVSGSTYIASVLIFISLIYVGKNTLSGTLAVCYILFAAVYVAFVPMVHIKVK